MEKNILLVGVGGQGVILASNILSQGFTEAGYDVKMSEVHGMAQRGGSVSTQIRFGEKIYSPIIGEGEADILVSFEEMEALRYLKFLKPEGSVVVNTIRLPSAPIQAGEFVYPEGILEEVQKVVKHAYLIDATGIAKELGNEKVTSVVLFGAVAKLLDLQEIDWEEVMSKSVKEKFIEVNKEAYQRGRKEV